MKGNTINFFKNIWHDIQSESKLNVAFPFVLLLLITIPFPTFINNITLVTLLFFVIIKSNKNNFKFSISLFLPILLFVLMVFSFFWSIDPKETLTVIPKEIALLLIPFAFMLLQNFIPSLKTKILKYYSYSMIILVLFFLIRAITRYFLYHNLNVFFYHDESQSDFGLVPKLLNAIHVSVFVAIAFFYFFIKENKSKLEIAILILLFSFIMLLSSENIILAVIVLIGYHFFFISKLANKMRLRNSIIFLSIITTFLYYNQIKEKLYFEFQINAENNIGHNVIPKEIVGSNIISMKEAWTNEKFNQTDFFSGAAFRVYQFRMFLEIMKEEKVFIQGLGLNASYKKLEEKGIKYNVFQGNKNSEGYQKKNFHNQYIQNFAELGIVGFLLLIAILFINTKNAFQSKNFLHIAFAILMISLFLTESFLWRQRGVVFFTTFYCFFNSNKILNNK